MATAVFAVSRLADDTEVVPPVLTTTGFDGSGGSGSVPTGLIVSPTLHAPIITLPRN